MKITHTIKLLAPMSHGDPGAKSGNVMRFRRIACTTPDGTILLPALSAGALRGVVRRLLWREVFDACGMDRETVGSPAWDRLYAALANGGHIEQTETRVDPDVIRRRRRELPVLSLLGAALYTSHMSGRARPSHSWLICLEAGVCGLPSSDVPMRELLADQANVRHIDAEEQHPELSGVTPMPTTVECVVYGASLRGYCHVAAELEASAWAHGLDMVSYLGGKAGAGYGEVEIVHDGDGGMYREWLSAHIEGVTAALHRLTDELGPRRKRKAKTKTKTKAKVEAPPAELF